MKSDELISGIMQTLVTCGSVLALQKSFPDFKVDSLSTCTPAVWKQCRKQLEVKIAEKGMKAKLDWLPKQAPKSIDDIPLPTGASVKTEL